MRRARGGRGGRRGRGSRRGSPRGASGRVLGGAKPQDAMRFDLSGKDKRLISAAVGIDMPDSNEQDEPIDIEEELNASVVLVDFVPASQQMRYTSELLQSCGFDTSDIHSALDTHDGDELLAYDALIRAELAKHGKTIPQCTDDEQDLEYQLETETMLLESMYPASRVSSSDDFIEFESSEICSASVYLKVSFVRCYPDCVPSLIFLRSDHPSKHLEMITKLYYEAIELIGQPMMVGLIMKLQEMLVEFDVVETTPKPVVSVTATTSTTRIRRNYAIERTLRRAEEQKKKEEEEAAWRQQRVEYLLHGVAEVNDVVVDDVEEEENEEVEEEEEEEEEEMSLWRDNEYVSAPPLPSPPLPHTSDILTQMHKERTRTAAYRRYLVTRENLPAYSQGHEVLDALQKSRVVIVCGATGCGKTTQIPQCILDEALMKGQSANVVITQPRRLGATSCATRVAQERADTLGNQVGYSIRLENRKSANTKLLYCTTGILLRRIRGDGINLDDITHLILDECHERSIETDFLVCLVRHIVLPLRPDLNVVLMSATLDANMFSQYFGGCPIVEIPGRSFPVDSYFLDDVLNMTGFMIDESSSAYVPSRNIVGHFTVDHSIPEKLAIDPEFIRAVISHAHSSTPTDHSILVFMPGMAEITALCELLQSDTAGFGSRSFMIIPLHSTLSSSQQQTVFHRPPDGVRKIVIATNIAETSLTIDDIAIVIDSCRVKENSWDSLNNMPALVDGWVSKASAAQRRGRAGRVRPGVCYHLVTEAHFDTFRDYQIPEMRRVPLTQLILSILVMNIGRPAAVLLNTLDPPPMKSIVTAIRSLRDMAAVHPKVEKLTSLGRHISALPIDAKLAKMLIWGALFKCLDPVLTLAAAMSLQSRLFSAPFDKRRLADAAKRKLSDHSDHFVLLNAYNGWRASKSKDAFLWDHFLSPNAIMMIHDMRRQLHQLLADIGMADVSDIDANANNKGLIKAILCSSLYPNVIRVTDGGKTLISRKGECFLHPGSSLFNAELPYAFLVCFEMVKTSKVYVRDATPCSSFSLMLFGGQVRVERGYVTVDRRYSFKCSQNVAKLVQSLRFELDELLRRKIEDPHASDESHIIDVVTKLL